MYRQFFITTLLFILTSAEPRTPKIYNVLISTKKNLSPSHALPVYEPVLRTTSLGLALPPLLYQTPYQTVPIKNLGEDGQLQQQQPQLQIQQQPQPQQPQQLEQQQIQQNGEEDPGLHPYPVEQFIPYAYTPQLLNQQQPYYSAPSQQANVQQPQQEAGPGPVTEESTDPKNVIANLKRNPEIPDVPPPALPVKTS